MSVLPRQFYSHSPLWVARNLIGKKLVRNLGDNRKLEGIIVETEAYGGSRDSASHAFRGRTQRNSVMFGEPGHVYVYFTYGFHHCLNFVTGRFMGENAGAVLVRALEPVAGIQAMFEFRGTKDIYNVSSGPGKLCEALQIDLSLNGCDATLESSPISVVDSQGALTKASRSPRVGIRLATEKQWRFFIAENSFVSRAKLIYPGSDSRLSRP